MLGKCVKVDQLSEIVWTAGLQNLVSGCYDLVVGAEADWMMMMMMLTMICTFSFVWLQC